MFESLRPRGMARFYVLWAGSLVSLFGATMTSFLLGILAYQQTKSATAFALVLVSYTLPSLLLAPVAGALVDRWNRKWVMMAGVVAVTISTCFIALLIYLRGGWDWRIYLAVGSISVVDAFVTPAYFAVTAMLVPKEQLVRANSCWQFNYAAAGVIRGPLALFLAQFVNVWGVIVVDVITYILVLFSIMLVDIPEPERKSESTGSKAFRLKDMASGWDYIKLRRGLLRLLAYMTVFRFAVYMTNSLFAPMVLSMGASTKTLAIILSVGGIGSAVGSATVAIWGGPNHRIYGVLGAGLLLGCGVILTAISPSHVWMVLGFLLFALGGPIGGSCSQAVWQSKTEPGFQGRVASLERMLTQSTLPIAALVGTSLADKIFVPLLLAGGPLAATVGKVIGVGPGRGIGFFLGLIGLLVIFATAIGYASPRLRGLEKEVADGIGLPSKSDPIGIAAELLPPFQEGAAIGGE
jgi:DHA3 family macrolide efflux protein-like MFS transporter